MSVMLALSCSVTSHSKGGDCHAMSCPMESRLWPTVSEDQRPQSNSLEELNSADSHGSELQITHSSLKAARRNQETDGPAEPCLDADPQKLRH